MLRLFVDALGLELGGYELGDLYAELSGDVEVLPSPEAIERAFAAIGASHRQTGNRARRRFSARIGEADLSCLLIGPETYRGRLIGNDHVTIEWRNNAPVEAVQWDGRSWPSFFDSARVFSASRRHLMLEGQIAPGTFASCVARYRALPFAVQLEEPDLVVLANATHVMKLQDRGEYPTLYIELK